MSSLREYLLLFFSITHLIAQLLWCRAIKQCSRNLWKRTAFRKIFLIIILIAVTILPLIQNKVPCDGHETFYPAGGDLLAKISTCCLLCVCLHYFLPGVGKDIRLLHKANRAAEMSTSSFILGFSISTGTRPLQSVILISISLLFFFVALKDQSLLKS
jgi:hypothetical protein